MTIDLAWNIVLDARNKLNGWCSIEKNKYLFDLTYNTCPSLVVEIGVYEGLSLASFSAASLLLNNCNVIGIDSYNIIDITDTETNIAYVSQLELDTAKEKMNTVYNLLNLPVNMIYKSSLNAYYDIFSNKNLYIDILHIDASHTEHDSVLDTLLWMPRIKSGGFLIYDDANWDSLQLAQKFALKKCKHIDYLEDKKTRILQKI